MIMCSVNIILLICVLGTVAIGLINTNKVEWDYTLLSFEMKSSDETKIKPNFKTLRVSRGVYAVNGTGQVYMDLDEKYKTKLDIYHSSKGNSQFTLLPHKFRETNTIEFLNSYYKQYIMESIKDCSNLLYFKNEWKKPFPKGEYYAKNCLISNKNLPPRINEGHYKFVGSLFGPYNFKIDATALILVEYK